MWLSPGSIWRPWRVGCPAVKGSGKTSAVGWAASRVSITSSFSTRNIEQVAYNSRPSTASRGHRACNKRRCCVPISCTSAAVRRRRISGWRRMTPSALQGASHSILSNSRPSHQLAGSPASAAATAQLSDRRARFSATRVRRVAELSIANSDNPLPANSSR